MCNIEKQRITVLMGAGVPLNLESQGGFFPSTQNITNEVLDTPYKVFDIKKGISSVGNLITEVYKRCCEEYHPEALDPTDKKSAGKVHFEILFYVLEMLETYVRSKREGTVTKYVYKFAPFITSDFKFDPTEFYSASKHLIDTIIKCVRKYDDVFSDPGNDWYRDFWRKNSKGWDFFNLNYDTTVEQSVIDYEDGYEDIIDQEGFQRFNVRKLLTNNNGLSTINHMHGCLLYGGDRYKNVNHDVYDYDHQDMYKWPDVNTSYDRWIGSSSSSGTAQDGSVIVQGPIITGLSKTDKVTCLPYDGYRNNFFNCIAQNNGLLIAGYSFGDYYINQMFYRLFQLHGETAKVVLIDFWDIAKYYSENEADEGEPALTDSELRPRYFEHYFTLDHGNNEILLFVKRAAHRDYDVWDHFNQLSLTGPMISDNGRLMLFIGGFKNAIEKHGDEIIQFLKS